MKKFINIKNEYTVSDNQYPEKSAEFIGSSLKEIGINKKLAQKTELLCEETITQMTAHAPENASLGVKIRRSLGDVYVSLQMQGREFDMLDAPESYSDEMSDEHAQTFFRSLLFRSLGENYKYSHKNGVNKARIAVGASQQSGLIKTIIAMLLGLFVGILMKTIIPESAVEIISTYALTPFKTMFMNALKIIIAPVVFFSIVTCFSQFKSVAELGRLGAKVMGMYLLTTVIAVVLGFTMVSLIQPGEFGFALGTEAAGVNVSADVDTSLLHTIVDIVPDNFLSPFLNSSTLQIIFLAVLCGIAVGRIGQYSKPVKDIFESCNSLFLEITMLIAKAIPAAVFCSVALMVNDMDAKNLLSVLGGAGVQISTILTMMCIYGLLVLILARVNPLKFYKKASEGMITSFTLCSSSAAMPTNLRVCTDKLGVHPKVCNFSIPLGATVNMDGTCIFLSVLGVFIARAYGIDISFETMISAAITIILLSLGAPGVPGSAFICMGVVLKELNVPIEGMSLIFALAPILDMFDTMSNTTGDVAAAVIVAKSEKLLDVEKYNS